MAIKLGFFTEQSLLSGLQAGNPEAYRRAIERYSGNMAISAYGWVHDSELASRVAGLVFIRLQAQRYVNATVPLEKYLIDEVKADCILLLGLQ